MRVIQTNVYSKSPLLDSSNLKEQKGFEWDHCCNKFSRRLMLWLMLMWL